MSLYRYRCPNTILKFHYRQINEVCGETMQAPIHVAMDAGHIECIQEIIVSGSQLHLVDGSGNSVFHYAAKVGNPRIIQACLK